MAFILIEAWGQGITPQLLHRATEENLSGGDGTRSNTVAERPDPRVICEANIYRFHSKQIAIPGAAIARMLREAGGAHKAKGSRKSIKYLVPASTIVLDDLCGLYLNDRKTPITDFEVDSRPVTIPSTKGRIMRHRARLNEWSFRVNLRINDEILTEDIVRRLMVEGLQQIGLGDYRPERGGPFGTSDLVAWTQLNVVPLTTAQRRNTTAA
jgi:hypothetical protein